MKRTKLYLLVVIPVLSLCVSCGDGTDFDEGDRVLANYHVAGYAYPAVITEIEENGISVQYLDDESTETLDSAAVRAFDWEEDSEIECARDKGSEYYAGRITDFDDPDLEITYDSDDEEEDTTIARCRQSFVGAVASNEDSAQSTGEPREGSACPGTGHWRVCNGECVDLANDSNHCGACGNQCRDGTSCDGHLSCRDAEGNL